MKRINNDLLASVDSSAIQLPQYDRAGVKPGIVHLGIGAFHRAHQAFYTEAVLNQFGGDWGIIGCSLRSASVKTQLAEQDGLYTLVERGPEGEKFQIMGAVQQVVVGPEDPAALVAIMANPQTQIVSLTVTEKGYCHDPATGNLNLSHPDIQHDLGNLNAPKSAIGYIVAALLARKESGQSSFTVLSCDNLPNNGEVLEKVVLQFAKQVSAELCEWVSAHTKFPSTMIDRIVPATTDSDRADLEAKVGYRDEGMVVAEPFTQWVIEDKFCSARPQWEQVGALLVEDVTAFEKMKLRLLNGSHSMLAYAGYLAGFETISDVMTEPAFVSLCKKFMDTEAGPTVKTPDGFDIEDYKKQLRDRFANPGLKHRTWQIAMDGSQKIPQRLLETLREQLASGGSIEVISLAIAAWFKYVSAVDDAGNAIDVQDPLAARLKSLCDSHPNTSERVAALLGVKEVFGEDLVGCSAFAAAISAWLDAFAKQGVLATIKQSFSA